MNGDTSKLAAILGMMGSNFDGEVLNAARKAEQIRVASGKTWKQLLDGSGGSSSMSSSEAMWKSRAIMAEAEVIRLRMEVMKAKAGGAQASGGSSTHKPFTSGSKFDLPKHVEDEIVAKLTKSWMNARQVKKVTGWNTPKMSIRIALGRIAKKRNLTLKVDAYSYGDGMNYRFA